MLSLTLMVCLLPFPAAALETSPEPIEPEASRYSDFLNHRCDI
jgi:hypothetical protein